MKIVFYMHEAEEPQNWNAELSVVKVESQESITIAIIYQILYLWAFKKSRNFIKIMKKDIVRRRIVKYPREICKNHLLFVIH